jgi:hypothetical protein
MNWSVLQRRLLRFDIETVFGASIFRSFFFAPTVAHLARQGEAQRGSADVSTWTLPSDLRRDPRIPVVKNLRDGVHLI